MLLRWRPCAGIFKAALEGSHVQLRVRSTAVRWLMEELGLSPTDGESQQRDLTNTTCWRSQYSSLPRAMAARAESLGALVQSDTLQIWEERLETPAFRFLPRLSQQYSVNTSRAPDVCVIGDKQNQLAK